MFTSFDFIRVIKNINKTKINRPLSKWLIKPSCSVIPSKITDNRNGARLTKDTFVLEINEKQAIPKINAIFDILDPITVPVAI